MSYRDPYGQGARDTSVEYYNPYHDHSEPHRTYDQGGYDQHHTDGYRDEPFQPPAEAIQSTYVDAANAKERATFGATRGAHDRCVPWYPSQRGLADRVRSSASEIRAWRYNHQGNLWTSVGIARLLDPHTV